ncbi:thioredoxin-like protein [Annulohypoxylon maeteangense]|uniref:thioredoxin-like protein n=1 Tax=Annulohypoxylon maeteangense TaxID=1927788 RepID=UPI002008D2E2|nr:thioredoxin-like protein [Annulohypoxylon maeteangense]KAI0888038.1 thioredoxin-like protein [Annulohypoxylon maeteangense]
MASIQDLLSPVVDRNSNEPEAKGQDALSKSDDVPETTHFMVEFILDVICPYCYIGLKNLTAAITTYTADHPEATFEIVCSPFMLDPLATRSAYPKATYLNIPKHSLEHWRDLGKQAGIDFTWEGRTGNTRDAHKLLRYALEAAPTTVRSTAFTSAHRPQTPKQGKPHSPAPLPDTASGTHQRGPPLQLRLLCALLHAHHETDADISSRDFLSSLVPSDLDFSPSVFTDPAWDRALDVLFADACERPGLAVRAVPTFIVNDRYVIGGAQSAEFLVEALGRIRVGKGGRGRDRGQVLPVDEGGVCARFYADGEKVPSPVLK